MKAFLNFLQPTRHECTLGVVVGIHKLFAWFLAFASNGTTTIYWILALWALWDRLAPIVMPKAKKLLAKIRGK